MKKRNMLIGCFVLLMMIASLGGLCLDIQTGRYRGIR